MPDEPNAGLGQPSDRLGEDRVVREAVAHLRLDDEGHASSDGLTCQAAHHVVGKTQGDLVDAVEASGGDHDLAAKWFEERFAVDPHLTLNWVPRQCRRLVCVEPVQRSLGRQQADFPPRALFG